MVQETKVKFTTIIDNPNYRYGDLNRTSYLTVEGIGTIVEIKINNTTAVAIVVCDDTNKFYIININNLKRIKI